jgi:hypothetical protein
VSGSAAGAGAALVIALDARIGNLETALRRTETSLRRTDSAAKQTQTSVARMGESFNRMGSSLGNLGGRVRSAVVPLLAAFTGAALASGLAGAVRNINALADAAAQVGVQADQLQAIQIAFEEAGSSAEVAQRGLGRLATLIGDAVRGGEDAQETFVKLGVSFRNIDGTARSTQQVFDQLSERIRAAASDQEALSIAAEVFGARGARGVVAAIREMGLTIDATTEKYRALGLIIGTGTAEALDRVGTSFANLGRAAASAAADMVASFEPQIVKVVDGVREMGGKVAVALQPLRDIFNRVFGDVQVPSFDEISAAIVAFVDQAVKDFGPLFESFMRVVRELAPVVQQIVTLVASSFYKVAQDLAPIATWIMSTLGSIVRYVRDALRWLGILEDSAVDVAQRAVDDAERALASARGQREQAEAMGTSASAQVRNRASAQAVEALDKERDATLALARAREALTTAQGRNLSPTIGPLPNAPTVTAPTITVPEAPRVDASGSTGGGRSRRSQEERDAERSVRELNQRLERLFETTRQPLEEFNIRLTEMWEAVAAQGQGGVGTLEGGMDTVRRAILQYAEQAAQALSGLGSEGTAQAEALREQLTNLGPALLESGAITDIESWAAQVGQALQKASGHATDFWSSFQRGMGLGGKDAKGFNEGLGEGLGKLTSGAFDSLFDLFDKVAEGSMKAGEALKQFALDFVKSVAKMVAQQSAMQMVSAMFGGGGGGKGGGGGLLSGLLGGLFGGVRMAGGATAVGYTYLVGERGPELFTAPAAGRIVPNAELGGGGMQVVVNQNAPGVVVESKQIDERTVQIAVNRSRAQIAQDFAESARTGHGPYSEPLGRHFAVRRRL